MARDDYRFSGPLRRVVVIKQKPPVEEDVQEVVQENVQEDVQEVVSMDQQPQGEPFGGQPLEATKPTGEAKELRQLRGGYVLKIDEESGNWIKMVRDAGGGITMGPKDGVIAVPDGGPRVKGFIRDMLKPQEEPEPEQAVYPKDFDEYLEAGRKVLENPLGDEEDEFESAVEKAMGSIRNLMANVERAIYERRSGRKHE